MTDHHPLREAAEAATAGPWTECHNIAGPMSVLAGSIDDERLTRICWLEIHGQEHANATFIARANPSKVIALLDENAGLRAALEGALLVLELSEHQSHEDPTFGAEVRALGERIGFGALMTSASASWAKYAQAAGHPGSEFVVGPCRSTLTKALALIRQALGSGK